MGCAGRPASPPADDGPPAALVLDGTLADPAAHRGLLARLSAAGVRPIYRRFDPRLGEADLERYRVVVWLGGALRGATGSLAVTGAEVGRAIRFVEGGGRLALGVPHGRAAGGAEGAAFGAVLERLGVPIAIEAREVVDLAPGASYAAALMRAPLFAPDPEHPAARGLPQALVGARSAPLVVGRGARPLLWTGDTAFLDRLYGPPPGDPAALGRRVVAADARAGRRGGRVLVASRSLLGAGGALFGATFEPLLPASLPSGALAGRERLLANALAELVEGLPGLSARAPVSWAPTVEAARAARDAACGGARPGERWLAAEGARVGWGYVDRPEEAMRPLLARLPASGLNALWGPAESWAGLAGGEASARVAVAARERVARVETALAGTGVRWLAGVNVPGTRTDLAPYPRAVTISGLEVEVPSPVDLAFWDGAVVPQATLLARAAGRALAGVVFDLEMYRRPVLYWGDGFDFGDGPFLRFLDDPASGLAPAERDAARRLPPAARGDWLLEKARLPAYYAWLEARAEAVGRRLRQALDEAAPGRDLALGFYAVSVLPSWFYRGLWRGASAGGRPVLLLTFQTDVRADLAAAAAEGTCLRHALAALLGVAGQDGLAPLLARAAREHDGFWLNRLSTLVEREAGYEAVERPGGLAGEAAWAWVRAGVDAYLRARAGE